MKMIPETIRTNLADKQTYQMLYAVSIMAKSPRRFCALGALISHLLKFHKNDSFPEKDQYVKFLNDIGILLSYHDDDKKGAISREDISSERFIKHQESYIDVSLNAGLFMLPLVERLKKGTDLEDISISSQFWVNATLSDIKELPQDFESEMGVPFEPSEPSEEEPQEGEPDQS